MNPCCPPSPQASAEVNGVKPRYAVDGEQSGYAIRVELPGVKKDDVSVHLENNLLTIHARRSSAAPADWKPLHRELLEDDFHLRLKLNAPVDEGQLTARLEHGVLTVSLPLKETAKPRMIPVG